MDGKTDKTANSGGQGAARSAGRRRPYLRAILAIAIICGLGFGIWGAIYQVHNWPVHHFGTVKKGMIYRSAQPTAAEWPILEKNYHIRTVIDLRSDEPAKEWSIAQRDFCQKNGVKLIRVAIGPHKLTDAEFKLLMDTLTDAKDQPVLVHCELGKLRTGVVIAAYRIAVDGWSCKKALAESREFKRTLGEGYEAYLHQLERRVKAEGPAGVKATIEKASAVDK